jgi:hypothetical protein
MEQGNNNIEVLNIMNSYLYLFIFIYIICFRVVFLALEELVKRKQHRQQQRQQHAHAHSHSHHHDPLTSPSHRSSISKTDDILDADGIIFDVLLLGTPIPIDYRRWQSIRTIVHGRLINGYCQHDWILKFIFSTQSLSSEIAGLLPVLPSTRTNSSTTYAPSHDEFGIENFDLSHLITGHMGYKTNIEQICKYVKWNE